MRPFGSGQPEKESHKIWPQIVTLLLALSTSFYTLWSQVNEWFYVVPVTLTLVVLFLLARDSGFFRWLRNRAIAASANRTVKRRYASFAKLVSKATVYQELADHLRNNVEWPPSDAGTPSFVNMHFANWYSDILHSVEFRKNVRCASELELMGSRLHDFLDVLNSYYLRPYADALRSGKAKYKNEQAMKDIRQAKASYDRFLELYSEFCEELNTEARRRVLVAIYTTPPPMDWTAAQKAETTQK